MIRPARTVTVSPIAESPRTVSSTRSPTSKSPSRSRARIVAACICRCCLVGASGADVASCSVLIANSCSCCSRRLRVRLIVRDGGHDHRRRRRVMAGAHSEHEDREARSCRAELLTRARLERNDLLMYAEVIAPAVLEVRGLSSDYKSLRLGDLEANPTASQSTDSASCSNPSTIAGARVTVCDLGGYCCGKK